MKGWKKVFYANENQRKGEIEILISDKIDLKTKTVARDKQGHYVIIKGSIQEDITFVNIYTPNVGPPKYIKQILKDIKGEIDSNMIIVGDFKTHLH